MELVESKEGGVLVLSPVGRVDSVTCKPFEQTLMERIGQGETRILIDFDHLVYISSAGLRVLLMGAKRLKAAKGRLVLSGMRDAIREVFEVSGFASILEIHPDRATALATFA